MNRINKFRAFKKHLKYIVKKLAAAETCPLGADAIAGFAKAKRSYNKLNENWQAKIDHKVSVRISPYFTPDETGVTPYDQDKAFMFM